MKGCRTLPIKSAGGTPSGRGKSDRARPLGSLAGQWAPVMIWLCFIFWMSTGTFSAEHTFSVVSVVLRFLFPGLSPDLVVLVHVIVRKAAHITEYLFLSLLLFRAFRVPGSGWRWRYSVFAMMGVTLWALGDEFHQLFVPGRTGSLMDVGIDVAGGALGQLAIFVWRRHR